MPYDKLIDSAQLDGAITATADAIRTKTGATDKIAWNESSGFASAIAAIASGKQIAMGSFELGEYDETRYPYDTPIEVTGLPFTPSQVFIFVRANGYIHENVKGRVLYGNTVNYVNFYVRFINEEDEEFDLHVLRCDIKNNGFKIYEEYLDNRYLLQWVTGDYYSYIAIE